jgi:hypothetical protein
VCLRDASITLPYSELVLRTSEGIPYAAPEVVPLFKAKHLREKDIADFQGVLPTMDQTRRSRLIGWLAQVHPGHPWIETLAIHRDDNSSRGLPAYDYRGEVDIDEVDGRTHVVWTGQFKPRFPGTGPVLAKFFGIFNRPNH